MKAAVADQCVVQPACVRAYGTIGFDPAGGGGGPAVLEQQMVELATVAPECGGLAEQAPEGLPLHLAKHVP